MAFDFLNAPFDQQVQFLTDQSNWLMRELKLEYNEESIQYLNDYIQRWRGKLSYHGETVLILSIGAFFGFCIIHNYGGEWHHRPGHYPDLKIEAGFARPITKVQKCFELGETEDITGFYHVIPHLIKSGQL